MDNKDLKRRLDAVTARTPEGDPDLGGVVRTGQRAKRRRTALVAATTVLVLTGAALGATAVLGDGPRSADIDIADHTGDGDQRLDLEPPPARHDGLDDGADHGRSRDDEDRRDQRVLDVRPGNGWQISDDHQ